MPIDPTEGMLHKQLNFYLSESPRVKDMPTMNGGGKSRGAKAGNKQRRILGTKFAFGVPEIGGAIVKGASTD